MSYGRIALAALGGTVAYFAFGGLVFGLVPILREEFRKYPAIYRPSEAMKGVFPIGILATFVAIAVVAVLFSRSGASGAGAGVRFGALIGLFVVCAFVLHNYVNLNIGWGLTIGQAVAYFAEWTIVGLVVGAIL